MKPTDLLLRCYARKEGNRWEAFCIDLCLATSGLTLHEAKQALRVQIKEYVYDAVLGEDQDYAEQLLTRKARSGEIARYHFYRICQNIYAFKDEVHQAFRLQMALTPSHE